MEQAYPTTAQTSKPPAPPGVASMNFDPEDYEAEKGRLRLAKVEPNAKRAGEIFLEWRCENPYDAYNETINDEAGRCSSPKRFTLGWHDKETGELIRWADSYEREVKCGTCSECIAAKKDRDYRTTIQKIDDFGLEYQCELPDERRYRAFSRRVRNRGGQCGRLLLADGARLALYSVSIDDDEKPIDREALLDVFAFKLSLVKTATSLGNLKPRPPEPVPTEPEPESASEVSGINGSAQTTDAVTIPTIGTPTPTGTSPGTSHPPGVASMNPADMWTHPNDRSTNPEPTTVSAEDAERHGLVTEPGPDDPEYVHKAHYLRTQCELVPRRRSWHGPAFDIAFAALGSVEVFFDGHGIWTKGEPPGFHVGTHVWITPPGKVKLKEQMARGEWEPPEPPESKLDAAWPRARQ